MLIRGSGSCHADASSCCVFFFFFPLFPPPSLVSDLACSARWNSAGLLVDLLVDFLVDFVDFS